MRCDKEAQKGPQRSTKGTTATDPVVVALSPNNSCCVLCFLGAEIFTFAGKLVALTLFLRAPYSGRSLFEGSSIAGR